MGYRSVAAGLAVAAAVAPGVALGAGAGAGSVPSGPPPAIALSASTGQNDVIGQKIVYNLRDDINDSSLFSLAASEKAADYVIEFVSMKDGSDNGGETTTAYSFVILNNQGVYLDSSVGVCGSDRAVACAQDLMASAASDIHDVQNNQ